MNQSLLLNDDIKYIADKASWLITGFHNGLAFNCYIANNVLAEETNINQNILFDVEMLIDDWLETHEIENDVIYIS